MSRIATPPMRSRHDKAVQFVNELVLDLKLQLLGRRPHDPITFDRLDEWHKVHAHQLLSCREPTIFR